MFSKYINEENQEKAIKSFLLLMLNQDEANLSMDMVIQEIGRYFDADRAYIFEDDERKDSISNTYEWCAEGIAPEKDNLQGIPSEVGVPWKKIMEKEGGILIRVDEEYKKKEPGICEILEPQGIDQLMVAPFIINGAISGFLGVDNPGKHIEQTLFLSVAASSICKELMVSKEIAYRESLKKLSEEQNRYLRLISTLSREYLNVYVIDPEKQTIRILKLDGYVTEGLAMGKTPLYPYNATCQKYIQDRVYSEDIDMMKAVMSLSNIEKELEKNSRYTGIYRIEENGEIHYYQYYYARIEDSNDIVAGFQNVDAMIADEKAQREQLQTALEAARRANASKTDFLSRMSHDIRTPLNGILGLIDFSDRHPEDEELHKKNRAKEKIAAKHLLSLISDILELSKLDREDVELAREPFNILDLAADVLTITGARTEDYGVVLHHEDCRGKIKYPYVYGSPLHVRQILLNILSNAVKYNKPGGTIHCAARTVSEDGNTVLYRVIVSDTGIGMSPEFLEHLFEPFTQEKSDARSTFQGTGLGMAIVKNLVDKMNGTIDVKSAVGEGSTFVVTIPFEIADITDLPVQETYTGREIGGMRALLVEDNDLNMEIAKAILEDVGVIVTAVSNGQEAFDAFRDNAPGTFDVILMDLMMPVMDGLTATAQIRRYDRADAATIPIVAMTANAFAEDVKKCMDAGMNGHIAKPIDLPKVVEALAAVKRF